MQLVTVPILTARSSPLSSCLAQRTPRPRARKTCERKPMPPRRSVNGSLVRMTSSTSILYLYEIPNPPRSAPSAKGAYCRRIGWSRPSLASAAARSAGFAGASRHRRRRAGLRGPGARRRIREATRPARHKKNGDGLRGSPHSTFGLQVVSPSFRADKMAGDPPHHAMQRSVSASNVTSFRLRSRMGSGSGMAGEERLCIGGAGSEQLMGRRFSMLSAQQNA